jgi:hypothetical protein
MEHLSDWQDGDDEVISVGERLANVIHVEATGPLTLFVKFDDGIEGEVRFTPSHLRGVFEKLKDPDYFSQVGIHYGAVSWPNEIPDLAPDNMHRHLKRDGEWVLQ